MSAACAGIPAVASSQAAIWKGLLSVDPLSHPGEFLHAMNCEPHDFFVVALAVAMDVIRLACRKRLLRQVLPIVTPFVSPGRQQGRAPQEAAGTQATRITSETSPWVPERMSW